MRKRQLIITKSHFVQLKDKGILAIFTTNLYGINTESGYDYK